MLPVPFGGVLLISLRLDRAFVAPPPASTLRMLPRAAMGLLLFLIRTGPLTSIQLRASHSAAKSLV